MLNFIKDYFFFLKYNCVFLNKSLSEVIKDKGLIKAFIFSKKLNKYYKISNDLRKQEAGNGVSIIL